MLDHLLRTVIERREREQEAQSRRLDAPSLLGQDEEGRWRHPKPRHPCSVCGVPMLSPGATKGGAHTACRKSRHRYRAKKIRPDVLPLRDLVTLPPMPVVRPTLYELLTGEVENG